MKKFSSFGSFLGRFPTIMPYSSADCNNYYSDSNDTSISDEDITDFTHLNTHQDKTNEQSNLAEYTQTKQSGVKSDDYRSQSKNEEYYHYPQSDYDPFQASENSMPKNNHSSNQDALSDSQDLGDSKLSNKAQNLWACMRQHDDLMRKFK